MGNFYTDVILKDPRHGSLTTINDPALLEPGTRAAVSKMIQMAAAQGHDIRILETYRSEALQRQDYEHHLTQLCNVGVHGYGLACDLALYINDAVSHRRIYDPRGQDYGFFQALAVACDLIPGIGWGTPNAPHTFTDWDHVQRIPVFRQGALFAGTWYPPAVYNPYDDMRAAHIAGMAPAAASKPA